MNITHIQVSECIYLHTMKTEGMVARQILWLTITFIIRKEANCAMRKIVIICFAARRHFKFVEWRLMVAPFHFIIEPL